MNVLGLACLVLALAWYVIVRVIRRRDVDERRADEDRVHAARAAVLVARARVAPPDGAGTPLSRVHGLSQNDGGVDAHGRPSAAKGFDRSVTTRR